MSYQCVRLLGFLYDFWHSRNEQLYKAGWLSICWFQRKKNKQTKIWTFQPCPSNLRLPICLHVYPMPINILDTSRINIQLHEETQLRLRLRKSPRKLQEQIKWRRSRPDWKRFPKLNRKHSKIRKIRCTIPVLSPLQIQLSQATQETTGKWAARAQFRIAKEKKKMVKKIVVVEGKCLPALHHSEKSVIFDRIGLWQFWPW